MRTPGMMREVQRCKPIVATSQWFPDTGAKAHEMWDWVREAEARECWTFQTTWDFVVNEMETLGSFKEGKLNDPVILYDISLFYHLILYYIIWQRWRNFAVTSRSSSVDFVLLKRLYCWLHFNQESPSKRVCKLEMGEVTELISCSTG